MSIQFVVGPSGAGKSEYLQNEIIELSKQNPARKYLLIVPDQFNMQTQKDMVQKYPGHTFSNIEVLSFSRLTHRILEEVGGDDIPVLDDTGKSLIIRHIAGQLQDELTVMKSKLGRIGFISEVKSAISEFMQYGIGPDDLSKLIEQAADRRALAAKLRDLEVIYRAFKKFKEEKFITKEETLDIVTSSLHKSQLVLDSVICFDGFTGFTPIQERVIAELLLRAKKVIFSFCLDDDLDPYQVGGEQELFWLTRRSISRIKKIADRASVVEENAVYIKRKEDSQRAPELSHLERNLFRFPYKAYEKDGSHNIESLHIYKAGNLRNEVIDTCSRIISLTTNNGYKYRDIAIVAGDLGSYADDINDIAAQFGIPVYMDYSRSVLMSPFIEAIRAAFDVVLSDFSYESVFRFLRTGFGTIDRDACDELENFILRTGIRGFSAYQKVWTISIPRGREELAEDRDARLAAEARLNRYREELVSVFGGLHNLSKSVDKNVCTVKDYATAIYELMDRCGMYAKLLAYSKRFESEDNRAYASEYKQIYIKVIELLDQIVALIGEEEITLKEYKEILEAGFGEIKLGIIPQENDVVVVGDITRSRLKETKVLFLLGVNDGNIPGGISSGGIISDLDREYICNNTEVELAPTPREQIFTQRLYLYMNMAKPTEKLYVSFLQMNSEGKSMQASYLISELCKLFPTLEIEDSAITHTIDQRNMPAGVHLIQNEFARLLRDYAASGKAVGSGNGVDDGADGDSHKLLMMFESQMCKHNQGKVSADIYKVAFEHKRDNPLAEEIAQELYGDVINTSISRLERFASCAYAHFLTYGIEIRPRTEFGFERRDLGDVFHLALERFATQLESQNIKWNEYSEEIAQKLVDNILDDIVMTYGETILLSSARTRAMAKRMSRILKRTVGTLQYQVKQGEFVPTSFERGFSDSLSITDSENHQITMNVVGKIDRIDICEKNGNKYLRIVDYKSGNKDFDINALYHGLTLQLSIYMLQALKKIKGTKPAGMLYYHISDPMLKENSEMSEEHLNLALNKELKMKGIVSDDSEIVSLMDSRLASQASINSDVISVGYKKDGSFTSTSAVLSDEAFGNVLKYAEKELCKLTAEIMKGNISPTPCLMEGKTSPCDYCDYKYICKSHSGAPGYQPTEYVKLSDQAVLALIAEELEETSEELEETSEELEETSEESE